MLSRRPIGFLVLSARSGGGWWRSDAERVELTDALRIVVARRGPRPGPSADELDQLFRDHPISDRLAVAVLDPEARFIAANRTFLDVAGRPLHELARRLLPDGRELLYASHRAAVRDPDATLECVITVGRPFHLSSDRAHLVGVA